MDKLAQRVLSAPQSVPLTPRWVGLFKAEHIETMPGGMRLVVRSGGFIDTVNFGFAYFSQHKPSKETAAIRTPGDHYRHLSGNWYLWRQIIPF
ncbi:MAG: hypothetical protein M3347_03730 [Armatimonadota bacterium]|nr:hypothetical protein [Armatimonadota bacterium]